MGGVSSGLRGPVFGVLLLPFVFPNDPLVPWTPGKGTQVWCDLPGAPRCQGAPGFGRWERRAIAPRTGALPPHTPRARDEPAVQVGAFITQLAEHWVPGPCAHENAGTKPRPDPPSRGHSPEGAVRHGVAVTVWPSRGGHQAPRCRPWEPRGAVSAEHTPIRRPGAEGRCGAARQRRPWCRVLDGCPGGVGLDALHCQRPLPVSFDL